MLCQRCANLLRASRTAAPATAPSRKPFSSYSSLFRQRPAISSPTVRAMFSVARRVPSLPNPSLSKSSAFHTTASFASPAGSAETEASTSTKNLEKPDFLDEAESTIWDRLVREFDPVELVVQDISGGCGSMYGIEISSERFRGATMLKQQRMVNAVLGDLMKGWHGCQLKTRVP